MRASTIRPLSCSANATRSGSVAKSNACCTTRQPAVEAAKGQANSVTDWMANFLSQISSASKRRNMASHSASVCLGFTLIEEAHVEQLRALFGSLSDVAAGAGTTNVDD